MTKRLIATIISVLVLALGVPGLALATGGSDDDFGSSSSSNPIGEGLCVGASLDLSRASQKRCAREVKEDDDETVVDDKPNIEAGLCVGASLDLSQASQKRCVQQTEPTGHQEEDFDTDARTDKHHHKDHDDQIDTTVTDGHNDKDRPHHKDKDHFPADMPALQGQEYAALGDSVAAGLGLPNPIGASGLCGRTTSAYAFAVGEARGLSTNLVACSDATLGDLFTEQGVDGPNLEPQLDGAFAGGAPELITITAGANDIRWDDFLRKCYASTCGTASDEHIAQGLLTALSVKLNLLFQNIAQQSGGSPPQVIMTGYYQPLSPSCTNLEPRLTPDEIAWLTAQTNALNQTLENATGNSGYASFVPLDFTGHDICSNDPWVQTLDEPAPFHPTTEGQQAIAQAIIADP